MLQQFCILQKQNFLYNVFTAFVLFGSEMSLFGGYSS